jgi:hypothetical protein
MDMTEEEQEAARLAKVAKMEEEIREKEEEITTAKLAAETMYRGMGVAPGEENQRSRRRQEIHWDYDHKVIFETCNHGSRVQNFGERERERA